MAQVIAFRPRGGEGAAGPAALVASVVNGRRSHEDVFWLKENAELLNVLESAGQGDADLLTPYAPYAAALPERLRFFPQYYRFLLSIALDLDDMGVPGVDSEAMAGVVAKARLFDGELSDLQRAEARRLLARRAMHGALRDPGLDDRLLSFAARSGTFALPNRKAAYELTHIVFYLTEYGRRDAALGDEVSKSLHFAGLVALLEHNADLLAEICIAMLFTGAEPPAAWLAFVEGRRRASRITTGAQTQLHDTYHDWLMAEWARALSAGGLVGGGVTHGTIGFHVAPPDGPLRVLSNALLQSTRARSPDWPRMRSSVLADIGGQGRATLRLAEASGDLFDEFFAHFARAGRVDAG